MKGPAFDFARDVDLEIEQLPAEERFTRRGRGKHLREELLPLSRLALHFKLPGLHVEVEAFEDEGKRDGRITLSGFLTDSFEVEVTCTHSREKALREELLHQKGVVPGWGPIWREKGTGRVIAKMTATDESEQIEAVAKEVVNRFLAKAEKNYPKQMVLLIAFDNVSIYGAKAWMQLQSAIGEKGGISAGVFRWVFLLNCANNEMHQII